jgi:signal transduction histidine kinase
MIADSLPPRTAAPHEVGPKPAADAQLISDVFGAARRPSDGTPREGWLRPDLEPVERAFGRWIRDERARAGVLAARARATRLAEAADRASESIMLTFAADLLVCLAVERPWREQDVDALVTGLADVFASPDDAVAVQLLMGALRAPQLLDLPPLVALEVQLSLLVALSAVLEASLWVKDEAGRPACVIAAGETARTRRFRAVAARTLEGVGSEHQAGFIVGVAVRRWQTPWAALVIRTATPERVRAALLEAAEAFSPLLEREFLLQRNAERERSLVTASERRLARLGFDLHDGALQHLAALDADLRQVARATEALGGEAAAQLPHELHAARERVSELNRILRELAHSLEPQSLVRRPLDAVVASEADALRERTGIDVRTRVVGDGGSMTKSQKIALVRVLQEALTNIREHSNATCVDVSIVSSRGSVDVQISDDGDGFEVTRTLQDAAQRGRLGLVGSSERIRLLGGSFDIRSRPGGPTVVAVTLPRWQPLVADEPALQHAY